jgi:hypothetical protein
MSQNRVGTLILGATLLALDAVPVARSAKMAAISNEITIVAPAPAGEELCSDYDLTVAGQAVPVYSCRVSAVPFDQVWPGYQRPLDQTELAGFAYWDMSAPVKVAIQSKRPVHSVVVRPLSLGIKPAVAGDRITFEVKKPGTVVVEVNGTLHALHLFANAPQKDAPAVDAAGIQYFGPGVHHAGQIHMESNQSVYIAAGAVVYGSIQATGATNIRIFGRGIIDVSPYPRGEGNGAIRLSDCSKVSIEGVIMRDPDVWCCSLFGCRNVDIANVKLIGLWRYNSDGIDICNSQDVTVRNCFVRSYDDSIVLKGLKGDYNDRPVQHVVATGCVIWNDWGRALEIGAETSTPEISDVLFKDCDIIHTTHIAMDIQHGDRATIHDIRYDDIRVEMNDAGQRPAYQNSPTEHYNPKPGDDYLPQLFVIIIQGTMWSADKIRGSVRDVTLRNISVIGPQMPESSLTGFDAEHTAQNITVQNLRFNGKRITSATDAQFHIGNYVSDVRFIE